MVCKSWSRAYFNGLSSGRWFPTVLPQIRLYTAPSHGFTDFTPGWMRPTKIMLHCVGQSPQQVGVSPTPTPDAETAKINQDLDSINVGDLNAEFKAIDTDLRGL